MRITRIEVEVGPFFTENCYILSDEVQPEHVVIVDPGAEADRILALVGERKTDSIILTHRHYDHIGALYELVQATGAKTIAHSLDAQAINDSGKTGRWAEKPADETNHIDRIVVDGDTIAVGTDSLTVIHTPGHSIGSMCLYNEKDHVLLAGDTLFFEEIGRTDLPTGSREQQRESLLKLSELPDETIVHPGHDADTTIGHEKLHGYLHAS